MANYFSDTPQLRYHLNHPLMERITRLKERDYTQHQSYDYAPLNHEDAMDSYAQVLEIVGDLCANIIAPNSADADKTGPSLHNGRVSYDPYTEQNLRAVRQAGLMGMNIARPYGGLNFPITPYIMAAEIVSRSDAGFENLWGLQDCAETLARFGSEEQRAKFLPRICSGETMSMDLTEPDAGSDLQAVMLKATYNEAEGQWYLNGVKRFITNGDSHIHLVLARSEEGSGDARGLSMFIYDHRDGGVTVRRIENKMGIKSVPTCELVFKNAKAELCGERRMGLIKYVMSLMNSARLGIMAQAVGISEHAYQEAFAYAAERKQFGKTIDRFAPVYEMLALMRAKADATRAHLYETCRFVDMYKAYEEVMAERKLTPEERAEYKRYSRLADAFTPIGKGMSTELANQNVYDCVQIHGGSGYMKDYTCERLYRDVRITNIYEGTTQLQVVAAIRHVLTGTYVERIKEMRQTPVDPQWQQMYDELGRWLNEVERITAYVTEQKNQELTDFHARRLVELTAHTLFTHLLMYDAQRAPELFAQSARVYFRYAQAEMAKLTQFIEQFDAADLEHYQVHTPNTQD